MQPAGPPTPGEVANSAVGRIAAGLPAMAVLRGSACRIWARGAAGGVSGAPRTRGVPPEGEWAGGNKPAAARQLHPPPLLQCLLPSQVQLLPVQHTQPTVLAVQFAPPDCMHDDGQLDACAACGATIELTSANPPAIAALR